MNTKLLTQFAVVVFSASLFTGYVIYAQRKAQPPVEESAPKTESPAPTAEAPPAPLAPSSKVFINVFAAPRVIAEEVDTTESVEEVLPLPQDLGQLLRAVPLRSEPRLEQPERKQPVPPTAVPSSKWAPVFTVPREPRDGPPKQSVQPAAPRVIAPGSKSIDLLLFGDQLKPKQEPAKPVPHAQKGDSAP